MQFVDGVGDLADLLGGVHRDRHNGSWLLAGAHPVDLTREVVMGHPQGAVAQGAQRTDQRPRHQRDQEQRQQDRGENDRRITDGFGAAAAAWSATAPVTAGTVLSISLAAT